MTTLHYEREFVVINCGPESSGGCGIEFAMPRWFYNETKNRGTGWTCPRGHERVWSGPTVEQKLEQAKARERHLADQLGAAELEAEQHRRQLLRDRHRIANGVCPCCNRSFTALRRHMATQHPDYDAGPAVDRPCCSCGARFDTYRGLRVHQGLMGQDLTAKSPWRRHATVVA